MFKKVLLFMLIFLCFGFFEGKDEKAINIIKNGYFDFDKTITIGKALDVNKLLTEQEWEYFETNRGLQVVEFRAKLNVGEPTTMTTNLCGEKRWESTVLIINIFNVRSYIILQFLLHGDDSFDIGFIGEKTVADPEFNLMLSSCNVDNPFENNHKRDYDYLKNIFYEKYVRPVKYSEICHALHLVEDNRRYGKCN